MPKRKRCELVDISTDLKRKHDDVAINWELCVLCQETKCEDLVCPSNTKRRDKGAGYRSLSDDLQKFMAIGALPKQLEKIHSNVQDLEHAFNENPAKYHKTCRNRFDNSKYIRLVNKSKTENKCDHKCTRSSISSATNINTCFFCDANEEDDDLVTAQTLGLHERVYNAAVELGDKNILAKLSAGDMAAIEAHYHKKCLAAFYNSVRTNASKNRNQDNFGDIYDAVLAEFVESIQNKRDSSDELPIFKLADITDMFAKRMCELGATGEAMNVHRTRLKEQLLGMIPELQAVKQLISDINSAVLSIAQLIRFNSCKRKRKQDTVSLYHHASHETPLPLYLGLMIHAKTRKRGIIDKLSKLGLCVTYQRVQEVSSSITNTLCEQYSVENVVCPPTLTPRLFTTAAIDNIDHNPASTTAVDSFHGTSISIIQHPDCDQIEYLPVFRQVFDGSKKLSVMLPEWYTHPPIMTTKKTGIPIATVNTSDVERFDAVEELVPWADIVERNLLDGRCPEGEKLPWSAYYASHHTISKMPRCSSTLLPLLRGSVQSLAMVRHTVDIITKVVSKLDIQQPVIITGDQPVYAIGKQLQWIAPDKYGEDRVLFMMGGLHTEMSMLKLIGKWLDGSGWIEIIIIADVATPGKAESFLSCSHVKRTRYAHQVTVASLHILLNKAWNDTVNQFPDTVKDEWVTQRRLESPQFEYWYTTMILESLLLMFVRSIREANFDLYVTALSQMCPWMFALDHTHYARWLPVFIRTLNELGDPHPCVKVEFEKGKFVTQKTTRAFSCISDDQAHEQNNRDVKTDGGAVGILDNETALLKWMVAEMFLTVFILLESVFIKSLLM